MSEPRSLISEWLRGVRYPFAAIGFMSRHRLWKVAGAAIAVNTLLLILLITLTVSIVWPWLTTFEGWLVGLSQQEWLQSLLRAAAWVVRCLVIILAFVANGLVLTFIGSAVAGPFLDILSERTEHIVLGVDDAPRSWRDVARSIAVAMSDIVWSAGLLVAVNLPLWLLGLALPIVGSGVATLISVALSAWIIALEFIGLPLARRLVSYRERWRVIRRHPAVTLGFGTAVLCVLAVPGVNLALLPLAAVGGTLLCCDLENPLSVSRR